MPRTPTMPPRSPAPRSGHQPRVGAAVRPAARPESSHDGWNAVRHVTVEAQWAGQRLDNFLMRLLKGVPKTRIYKIIRSGEVRQNGARTQADARVAAGDQLRLPPLRMGVLGSGTDEPAGGTEPRPYVPARDFPVLLEDEHLLAINKPAGVAVHGGSGVSFGVIEQLRQARPQLRFLELVHRLDRETSGILLVACRRSALTHLQDQFRLRGGEKAVGKTYFALVTGTWPSHKKVLDQPLRKFLTAEGERRVCVTAADDPEGMKAVTLVKVAQRFAQHTLLEVTIKTGRTHQIRVHLQSQGHAIVGDDKYGDFTLNRRLARGEDGLPRLERMFLHAARLSFTHPAQGQAVVLQAPLPQDLQLFLDALPGSASAPS